MSWEIDDVVEKYLDVQMLHVVACWWRICPAQGLCVDRKKGVSALSAQFFAGCVCLRLLCLSPLSFVRGTSHVVFESASM